MEKNRTKAQIMNQALVIYREQHVSLILQISSILNRKFNIEAALDIIKFKEAKRLFDSFKIFCWKTIVSVK